MRGSPRVFRLAAFDDAYTRCFHDALLQNGVDVRAGEWTIRWLARMVRRGDILHLHWPSALYHEDSQVRTWMRVAHLATTLLLFRIRGARIVWTAHNLYPHDGGRELLAHRVVRRLIVKLCSHICAHGPQAAECIKREFAASADKLVILEHGNWIGYYANSIGRHEARERLGIPDGAFLFLFLGLCRPYKNLEHLVRSHRSLEGETLLWIVGRFPQEEYYSAVKTAVSAAHAGQVEIRNEYVSNDGLELYLNACDAVVIPYKEVLTSGTAMLALSFGRPVIAPRLGALADVLTDDCGVLYDPSSEDGLELAMRSVLTMHFDPAKILDRARRFTWNRSAAIFRRTVVYGDT